MRISIDLLTKYKKKFWSNINVVENSCWIWKGAIHKNTGYGSFVAYYPIGAHRASYMFYTNKEIPYGYCVCHRCDNKVCVNPSHLFLGTIRDNNIDMIKKNRACFPKPRTGSLNRTAKLNDNKVKEIIENIISGKTNREISKRFNISLQTIYNIKIKRTWKHIWRLFDYIKRK